MQILPHQTDRWKPLHHIPFEDLHPPYPSDKRQMGTK